MNKLVKNTIMLYGITIAKIVFPLITLPYLTRVLSENIYGSVAFVKAFMSYAQLFIDFGFVLSATKSITLARDNKAKMGQILWNTILEKCLLALVSFLILLCCIITIPLLKEFAIFSILYFVSIVLSIVFVDFYFRGIEKMEMVSVPYVISKSASTIFTLVLIKSDGDIFWIPILEIVGNLLAGLVVLYFLSKEKLPFIISDLKTIIQDLKTSSVYFASNFATTFLGSFTTIVSGLALSAENIAYWSVTMQLVSAVKVMYSPITNSLYPHMILEPRRKTINKTLLIFMPIIVVGCIFTYCFSSSIMAIIGGSKYAIASTTLKYLVPVLFFSFPGMLFGWPTLGAIGKERQTTITTMVSAISQVSLLIFLLVMHRVSLYSLAISCCIAEFILLFTRYYYYRKYKSEFR